jgi:5-oxoprolinase (ATP-hydrolysing) subunit A
MAGQRRIDFNCDLGEGCGDDAAIMPFISSASIASGGHAGDAHSMRETVELCLRHGVAVGAHPSFEDREHFGRRELALPPSEIRVLVSRQLEAMAVACDASGTRLHHVKPHGALYNLSARDRTVADAIATAVRDFDPTLLLYGLSGSHGVDAAHAAGLRAVHEVFAERRYEPDGRLTPRTRDDAVIEGIDGALAQVRTMLRDGEVVARTGERVPLRADTLCLHGDRADAAAFARALREALEAEGVVVLAPGAPA